MYILLISLLFAFGKLYAAAVPSVESGNLPNEVWAYLESSAYANAVKPILKKLEDRYLI